MSARCRTHAWLLVVVLLATHGTVAAEEANPGNMLGLRGLLRMVAAHNHPAGWVGLGTDFQYFQDGDFLAQGEDHSRMINTYSIVWAPIRFLEAAFALHVTSDQSAAGNREELMVAVGDPEISIKGGAALGGGVSLGGLFDLRFPSGSGFFEPSLSATSFLFAALASWSPGKLPLGIHLNVGFQYDGSKNLFDKPEELSAAQRYAAQLSSFHRVVTRLGVEYNTRYIGPFLELSLEPYVGSGAPGFADSPGIISLGARAWPTKSKSVQLLVALDIGITGVLDGEASSAPATAQTDYAYGLPRWNLLVGASYRFDAYAKPETVTVEVPKVVPPPPEKPKTGNVSGSVVDAQSNKPIWNAQVSVVGAASSNLAVDPKDGTFRTFQLPVGKHTIVAAADGYGEARVEVVVEADRSAPATLQLAPKTQVIPGTLRGTVRALVGKNPASATVLIPEADQTVQVGANGTFSVQLKAGEYKVVVSADGFRTQTKKIRVLEGSTVILNVELHK